MNIVALKTFLTVVDLGNLNKAAERLNVTQSTVSARLDALENVLGQTLLLRSRRGAQMTKAGFALQRHAEVIVQAWDRGRRAVESPRGFEATFSVSCEHDLWEGNVATWIDEITASHPQVAVEVWPGVPSEIEGWLRSGLIDAAVTREAIAGDAILTQLFRRDDVIAVRAAGARSVESFVSVDHGPRMRRQTLDAGTVSSMTFGAGASRWALDHILRTGGAGYLPRSMVRSHLQTGELVEVSDAPSYDTECHLSWRSSSLDVHPWLSDSAQT